MRRNLIAVAALFAAACSDTPTAVETAALMSVAPADGMSNISTNPTIEVRFDAPVAQTATTLIALQMGDCPGPVVSGTWSRSAEGTVLSFMPMHPLDPGTRYTIHLGGGITSKDGTSVDMETHGPGLGGMWVTQAMVMGMNNMGMGMASMVSHAGPGWRHANGFFGLAFDFTTGPAGQ